MKYWLFKSEPGTWSWQQMIGAGVRGTGWTGVRNHQAKLNMMAMKRGDRGFFYHSGSDKEIVGIVEVCAEYHPDPTDESGKFGMVDVKAVHPMTHPVPLTNIKAEHKLTNMALVNNSRLSVQPVTAAEWKLVCALGGIPAGAE
jgi:predicted RNA-binding protein with PUA-like domain